MPVPGRPDERCGPLFFGLMRDPASRSIGRDSSTIVGYVRAFVSATTWRFGLMRTCGSGSASKTSTMVFGGSTYFAGSVADGTCAMSAGAARKRAMTMNRKGRAASMVRSLLIRREPVTPGPPRSGFYSDTDGVGPSKLGPYAALGLTVATFMSETL